MLRTDLRQTIALGIFVAGGFAAWALVPVQAPAQAGTPFDRSEFEKPLAVLVVANYARHRGARSHRREVWSRAATLLCPA